MNINIKKVNEVYLYIEAEKSIRDELGRYFSIYVDGWRFMRKKNPRLYNWDGKIKLYNKKTSQIYYGLLKDIIIFAKDRNYDISIDRHIKENYANNLNFDSYIKKLNEEFPFKLRDYQIDSFKYAIKNQRSIIVSPTSSGKSAIIYMIVKYLLDNNLANKILLFVPVTTLVNQMTGDFKEYGCKYPIHNITAGKDKVSTKSIYISTWQSIYTLQKEYFHEFDTIIQDECHIGVNANPKENKAIKYILENCINAKYRVGFTGTLRCSKDKLLSIQGLFGNIYYAVKTKELMDRKQVSNLKINIVKLKYTEEECKMMRKEKNNNEAKEIVWQKEIAYVEQHEKRNLFVVNFINTIVKKNTLVLFRHIKHGKFIYENLAKITDKQIYYIDGQTSTEEREEIRKLMEKENNIILVASLGTFSMGVNIKNLHILFFVSPIRSEIAVNQSLGRGLRLHAKKNKLLLFDIADDFNIGAYKCYCMKHLLARVKIYNNERFDFEEYSHNL